MGRKIFVFLSIFVFVILSCACGSITPLPDTSDSTIKTEESSSETTTEPTTTAPSIDYDSEFDSIVKEVDDMISAANVIYAYTGMVWAKSDGSISISEYINVLAKIKSIEEIEDDTFSIIQAGTIYQAVTGNSIKNETYKTWWPDDKSLVKKVEETVVSHAQVFQAAGQMINEKTDTVKKSLKALIDACGEAHKNGLDTLQDYYIKASSYGTMVNSFTGTLSNYMNACSTAQKELEELKLKVEFAK